MAEGYFDYAKMMNEIDAFMNKYPFVSVTGVCESILGRTVPAIILGEGESVVTYVGGEEGRDMLSPSLLVRFVRDICSLQEEGGSTFGFSAESILKKYTLVIIPMLNPDGSCYCSHGVEEDNPLAERVLELNGGGSDFSSWRGNARGVELKYNYGAERSEYEPEAEVGALCNFLRYGMTSDLLITFSACESAEGTIYFGEGEIESKIAVALSQMSGMKRAYRESDPQGLMLFEWAQCELSASAFAIDIPRFKASSRKQFEDKSFSSYVNLRKALFCAPFLNKIK